MRLQTTIKDADWKKVEAAAEKSGDDLNDVVRKALSLYVWVKRKAEEGYKIGAVDKDNKVIVILDLD